ncbi:MAG: carboxypeptidase regulatory-like domain-containing protein, partial [Acidobacteriaceae bacterium]|nr:carboxypeptidase regulatory-like domain-containing protein [Acidobacteriaceae bacterium]
MQRRLALPAILLLCVSARSQLFTPPSFQAQSAARYTVRGAVVNAATGEPIPRALVELNGPENHAALTGSEGQFQIEGVPAGRFLANARRPGFVEANRFTMFLGSKRFAGAAGPRTVSFTVGSNTEPVVIKLMPEGSIAGRVVDSDGEPVPNLRLQCFLQELTSGRKHWQATNGGMTNANGDFLVGNLPPGSCL